MILTQSNNKVEINNETLKNTGDQTETTFLNVGIKKEIKSVITDCE